MVAAAAAFRASPAEAARLLCDLRLQALLVEQLGWEPAAARVRCIRLGGATYPLTTLAQRGTARALLYTTAPSESIPDHAVRRRIRERVGPAPLLIFADPLRTDQIWQWTERTHGRAPLYREAHHLAGDSGEPLLTRLLQPSPLPLSRSRTHIAEVQRLLLPALLHRSRHRAPIALSAETVMALLHSPDPAHALQNHIEASEDVQLVRAVWHGLTRCTLLDPECRRGERLRAAAELLEPLYDACLERMQIWCADLDRARAGHRPEQLGDFRRLLSRVRACSVDADRHGWIRLETFRNNLFGMGNKPQRLQQCRRKLVERLSADTGPGAAEALHAVAARHLRLGHWSRAVHRPADVRRLLPPGSAARARIDVLAEEADVLHRAHQLLQPTAVPTADDAALEARHATLLRQLADFDRGTGNGSDRFHLWAEFPGAARRGGFAVVLGSPSPGSVPAKPGDTQQAVRVIVREPRTPFPAGAVGSAEGVGSAGPPILLPRGSPGYPPQLGDLLAESAPETVTALGNAQLLRLPLLGLFCSSRPSGALVLWALDAARALRGAGVPVIGGFQTPLERECLDLLLRGRQPVVVCPARGIDVMRLPASWTRAVDEGRLLLLSPFSGNIRRPTTRIAETRNRFAAALAAALLVVHAPAGSRTYALAGTALKWSKPVFAPDDPVNRDLLLLGVRPSTALREIYPNFRHPQLSGTSTAE